LIFKIPFLHQVAGDGGEDDIEIQEYMVKDQMRWLRNDYYDSISLKQIKRIVG
jgi:hypothetical protein